MLTRRNLLSAFAIAGATWTVGGTALAQKQPLQKAPNPQVLGQEQVEELLLLMDTDKNGKISKDEWMKFMEAEFDRLDKDKSGELDVHEIALSRLRATRHANTGK
jgi:hypothetical protein